MKYCINCGEKIEDYAEFCVKCGHKQSDSVGKTSQISLTERPGQSQVGIQKKKKKYSKDDITDAIGCIIIIAGIIVLIILYVFFEEWVAFLWPIIITIIVISCIIRLLGAGIVELIQRSKDKKDKGK